MKYYKLALWKNYFDQGYGITSYLKYLIAFFGLASRNIKTTMIIGIIYGLLCFLIGYVCIKSGFFKAQIEVSNKYNLFVSEVRNKLKKKSLNT